MRISMYRGKFAAVWKDGGVTRRASLGTADRAAAEAAFDRFRRALTGRASTVAEALQVYGERIEERGQSQGAIYAALRVTEHLGLLGLDDVTEARCAAYGEARRKQGAKDGTIIKELGVLRAALRHVKPNHTSIIVTPAQPPPRDRRITQAEFERLLAGAATPHIRLFLELAAATGGRAGALLALRWRQVDFEHGLIALQGAAAATNKRRATVPMTRKAAGLLQALHEARKPSPDDPVIAYDGAQIGSVKKAFGRAAERAGLADVTPHVIRHSVACWMAEAGVPMAEIAAFLGHTDSRVTERVYAKFSPAYLRRAVSILERECSGVQIEHSGVAPVAPVAT